MSSARKFPDEPHDLPGRKIPSQSIDWVLANKTFGIARSAFLAIVFFLLSSQSFAANEPPKFILPLDCEIGTHCFVQNYVDQAFGPAVEDHACGRLSYDGHKGTDIRVADLVVMNKGVSVLAAADGRIKATRDGMPDRDFRDAGPEEVRDRECGNGVIIDHGGGWQSKYCHMRRGSILTPNGHFVVAGQKLGLIGLSGKTSFPHLHFEVTRDGKYVDPFTGLHQRKTVSCNVSQGIGTLWKPSVLAALNYKTSGVISSGFATRKPDIKKIERGEFKKLKASVEVPVLLFWIQIYGMQTGDKSETIVNLPDGSVLAGNRKIHEGTHKAQWYTFIGKRRPKSGTWPVGTYKGRYRLTRKAADGVWREIFRVERKIELGPTVK